MQTHLHSAIAILCLLVSATAARAQRESFDASVTRRLEVLIVEPDAAGQIDAVPRQGRSAEGKTLDIHATRAAATFADIYFKFDSDELRDTASALRVDQLAQLLKTKRFRDAAILIEGHTCDLGEDDYNLTLSAKRAEAIRRLLIQRGVAPERLTALGFGETEIVDPVRKGDSAAEAEQRRMKSRRVVLRKIVPSGKK